eukprot:gnl/TRDRNA2_/TRDRNA2_182560_c0_seq1.p1 gnl/TRDRNA2_/TRDRNA2_182560_c0~~gnl/TRDRNA2_/TRDRNA2_182560_c0_seq1.p1  ORF type:complete len:346 (+),score=69.33 gnl/TRDRNA2_/TRDRNA2_182560_c0_seq1:73-1038(+)
MPDAGKMAKRLSELAPAVITLTGTALAGAAWLRKNPPWYTVAPGHKAIKFHRMSGLGSAVFPEGLHLMVPWFQRPVIFDVRSTAAEITSVSGSRDLQMVNISVRTLVRPNQEKLPEIYRMLGPDYKNTVLNSIVNEVLKSVVAQYNALELITKRELVSRMVKDRLLARAADFHILLEDVAITHLNFSPDYEKAVEQKQVSQQNAEMAKYLVLKAMEEKKRTIIHAEGEMQSAKLIGEAIADNPGFVELRKIAVAKEVSRTLAQSSNRMVLNTESLLLDLLGQSAQSQQGDHSSQGEAGGAAPSAMGRLAFWRKGKAAPATE